jgi:hypothetical protein
MRFIAMKCSGASTNKEPRRAGDVNRECGTEGVIGG